MRHVALVALAACGCLLAGPGPAAPDTPNLQQAAGQKHKLTATRVSDRITIDGRLVEAAWEQAPVATNFIQNEPREGAPATEQTEIRLLYDKDNLYIGVFARDSEIQRLIINELKKDFDRDSGDSVEIVLDTFYDRRNGYQFATNPAGAKWDAQMTNEGREINANWDAVWYVRTSVVEGGWTAEIAIPFKTLKFRDAGTQTWGINFRRNLRRKNEESFWAPLPRIYNLSRVSLAGTLEGLESIKPGSNIRFKPYFVTSVASVAGKENDYDADFGFDVKYGLTSGLTWDVTYNTDFSQVEADEQQVNLTRFNLFFPEKRDFFLENSGIFQFGGAADRSNTSTSVFGGGGGRQTSIGNDMIFFFSRRIGLSDDLRAIPILAGTRLTGRAGAYEMGLLNIQQRQLGPSNSTNFTVGRLRRNILSNSDVGVMVTNKEIQDSSQFNRVIGLDGNFRFAKKLDLNGYIVRASAPSISSRNLAGRFNIAYKDHFFDLRSSYTAVQENFIDEMGFVPRLGMRKYAGYYGLQLRPKAVQRVIRSMNVHTQIDYVLDRFGNLETRYIDYHFPIQFQDGSFIEIGVNPSLERLSKPFAIRQDVKIPTGLYKFDEYFIMARTDTSRRISANARWAVGRFYTGYKHNYSFSTSFRLNHKLNTAFGFIQNDINLREGHYKSNLLGIRLNYSFSTAMFLNALIQYNNDARQWSSNIRFNFIHRPLSDLFIVYNERRNSVSGELIDRALIGKFTYMISK